MRQSAVFGVPDADRTERVHAAVVLADEMDADEEELRGLVRGKLGAMYEPAQGRSWPPSRS